MNKEQAKLLISSLWGDVSNEALNKFLVSHVCKLHPNVIFNNNYPELSYNPIHIPLHKMNVHIRDHKNPNSDGGLSREIFFTDGTLPPSGAFIYSSRELLSEKEIRNIGIESGCIILYDSRESLQLSDDYLVKDCGFKTDEGLILDLVNRKIDYIGNHDDAIVFLHKQNKSDRNNTVTKTKWKSMLIEESNKTPRFSQIASELSLADLLEACGKTLAGGMSDKSLVALLMYSYIHFEELKYLLSDAWIRDSMISDIRSSHNHSRVSDARKESTFRKRLSPGSTFWEVLGFGSYLIPFLEEIRDTTYFSNLLTFSAAINLIGSYIPTVDEDSVKKLIEITRGKGHYHGMTAQGYLMNLENPNLKRINLDTTDCGYLLYLVKMGYTLDEVYDYLKLMERKQGVPIKEGITKLYQTVFFTEILTGKKEKILPKFLAVSWRRNFRDFNLLKEKNKTHAVKDAFGNNMLYNPELLQKIINRGAHLVSKNKEFEITLPSLDKLDINDIEHLMSGGSALCYRKKKGRNLVLFQMSGEAIVKYPDNAHRDDFFDWARENKFIS